MRVWLSVDCHVINTNGKLARQSFLSIFLTLRHCVYIKDNSICTRLVYDMSCAVS